MIRLIVFTVIGIGVLKSISNDGIIQQRRWNNVIFVVVAVPHVNTLATVQSGFTINNDTVSSSSSSIGQRRWDF